MNDMKFEFEIQLLYICHESIICNSVYTVSVYKIYSLNFARVIYLMVIVYTLSVYIRLILNFIPCDK